MQAYLYWSLYLDSQWYSINGKLFRKTEIAMKFPTLQKQNKKPLPLYPHITSIMEISYFYLYEHYQDNSSHLEVITHLYRMHILLCGWHLEHVTIMAILN